MSMRDLTHLFVAGGARRPEQATAAGSRKHYYALRGQPTSVPKETEHRPNLAALQSAARHLQAAADEVPAVDQDGFPEAGRQVWYDDQREVHRQIFEGDEAVDYAFMGQNPDAADNRWLREAFENRIPMIYFLGIAPGRYQAIVPTFVSGWDATAFKARVAFGVPDQETLAPPETRSGTALCAARGQAAAAPGVISRGRHHRLRWALRGVGVA